MKVSSVSFGSNLLVNRSVLELEKRGGGEEGWTCPTCLVLLFINLSIYIVMWFNQSVVITK